ncbi:MAG: hypothetical protein PHI12_11110 [Dehalococcoidales bacterium]|nr:hypothetical protein [Dehalococcoidales bacterium]
MVKPTRRWKGEGVLETTRYWGKWAVIFLVVAMFCWTLLVGMWLYLI